MLNYQKTHSSYNAGIAKNGKLFIFILALFSSISIFAQKSESLLWSNVSEAAVANKGEMDIIPMKFRALFLNDDMMRQELDKVISSSTKTAQLKQSKIMLPFPDYTNHDFYVTESKIMEEGLAAKYPQIRTFYIQEIGNSSCNGRVDYTQFGFHAIIFTPEGTVYIDPCRKDEKEAYICYYRHDFSKQESTSIDQKCVIEDNPALINEIKKNLKDAQGLTPGNELKTYRLALASTGEYSAYYSGTKAGALSGMVTTLNRVNAIYAKELSIKMVLIANSDTLICLNSATDPYTNSSGSKMLTENQKVIDSVIGPQNYDIGHVFSTGGGGVAYLMSVCRSSTKAGGVTGSSKPIGDPFDVDYVAHEMGHQFGGNHPFNGSSGNCSGQNRNAGTAYEPGSGTTIMAYAGICSPQNIQSNSDDYFHIVNINEIVAYTNSSLGYTCASVTPYNNSIPVVTVKPGGFYIPINTPFSLTGSATDADGDSLLYCWEEYDLGPQGSPTAPSGTAPIFRSFKPSRSATRIFPQLSDILNNKSTLGELLPSYSRNMVFRLSARDNKGGIGFSSINFAVTADAGPFVVTFPNTNIKLGVSSKQVVTWNVAGTDNTAKVNCQKVNILLSIDGGNTFPYLLAANTPNDGSEEVILPAKLTTTARIKIEAADNIFFDISDSDFIITDGPVPVELTAFNITSVNNSAKLNWETATETNNRGFEIERSIDKVNYELIGFVPGSGTTTQKSYYSFTDIKSKDGNSSYRLKQIDLDGTFKYSNTVDVNLTVVKAFGLEQNHPNPFNPSTTIKYSLQNQNYVTLKVFNVLGKQVAELVNAVQKAGNYKVEFNAGMLPSGVYYYQLASGGQSITKKMVVIK